MQRDNRRTEIHAFCLATHQFYVFNKPVMCISRVVLRCKNVTNTSLMCLSSTRPLMYLLHAVYVAKTLQCIRFTSLTHPEMCLFHTVLRRKFTRNSHVSLRKCMSYVSNKSVMRIFRVDLRCKNVTNTSLMRLSSTRSVM